MFTSETSDETSLPDVLTIWHIVEMVGKGVLHLKALCFAGLGQYLGYHFNNGLERLGLNCCISS